MEEEILPTYAGRGHGVIEPRHTRVEGLTLPRATVFCFFNDLLKRLEKKRVLRRIHLLRSELCDHPIYVYGEGESEVAVFHPGIGAPMAAALMEEMIALGADSIIACGGAGVLRRDLESGAVIIPTGAVREDGVSYHYQPRRRVNRPDGKAVKAIEAACRQHGTPFEKGLTWTTDAFYRETPRKVKARREEGCLTVEMEAAAFLAVAQFRRVRFAQLLYAGDDVSGKDWDRRLGASRTSAREKLLLLAIDAARILASE